MGSSEEAKIPNDEENLLRDVDAFEFVVSGGEVMRGILRRLTEKVNKISYGSPAPHLHYPRVILLEGICSGKLACKDGQGRFNLPRLSASRIA